MLLCTTTRIGYFAKFSWSYVPGSRTNESCIKQGETSYLCRSKLYFTPSLSLNGTEVTCYLVDESDNQLSVVRKGRILVGGKF